jgi:hypothetical protein
MIGFSTYVTVRCFGLQRAILPLFRLIGLR